MIAGFATLRSTESPWLLRTTIDGSELSHELEQIKGSSAFAICFLDGRKMTTINGVFGEFAKGLKFPDYFGFNSAAFDECLTDLSWLSATGICIVIADAAMLLNDESDEIEWLLDLLENAGKEWSAAIEEGEAWDRPAVPYHVLFHAALDSAEPLPPEISALPSLK